MSKLLVAFTLATLCFARIWKTQFFPESCDQYIRSNPITRRQQLHSLMTAIVLAGFIWVALEVIGFLPGRYALAVRSLFLALVCAIAAIQTLAVAPRSWKHQLQNARRMIARARTPRSRRFAQLGIGFVVLGLVGSCALMVVPLVGLLFPLAMLLFVMCTMLVAKRRPEFAKTPRAPVVAHQPGRRVIWLILDEFDQRLGFEARPKGLSLPNLDALSKTAFVASQAMPPCRCTEISIPAFLISRMVQETVVSENECELIIEPDLPRVALSSAVTLFDRLRQRGLNVALSGWYHPYDRLVGGSLVECRAYEPPDQQNSLPPGGSAYSAALLRSLLETPSYSVFGQSLATHQWIRTWEFMLRDAKEFAQRPELDLLFLHWTLPHAPHIYDVETGKTSLRNNPLAGYFGNLVLADLGFGELWNALAETGQLGNVDWIITSDHWWRNAPRYDGIVDRRVIFLAKLAGDNMSCRYSHPFNTVVIGDLVEALFEDRLASHSALAEWLKINGKNVPPTKL